MTSAVDRDPPLTIMVLSGGTGRTGQQVLRSALAQFRDPQIQTILKPGIRSVQAALKAVELARDKNAIVCHTFVEPKIREAVVRECDRHHVPAVDMLGPTLAVLDDHLDASQQQRPGLSYALNKEQFDRMDAVDFTLAHDDGARVKDLDQADVVLVGISRVSKSVTCFYLASRGIRAANIPLLPGVEPPEELLRITSHRVIGLTMNTQRLQQIRAARRGAIRAARLVDYTDHREIAREIAYAQALMKEHAWRKIDVSYKAVEEVAVEIIDAIRFPEARRSTANVEQVPSP
jgi:regulator of PEP synthase PpsR (kinase-PPPase family)